MNKAYGLLVPALLGAVTTGLVVGLQQARSQSAQPTSAEQIGIIVEYERPPPRFGRSPTETWTKQGDFIRVDVVSEPSDGQRAIRSSTYQRLGQQSVYTVGRYPDGSVASLFVMRDSLSHPPPLSERIFSGVTEKHLGQTCRVWRRSVPQAGGGMFNQSGCLSSEGVELWWRNANIDAIFAKAIRKVATRAGEVRPPLDLLDFRKWIAGAEPGDHQRDYEVLLSTESAQPPSKIERRSGNWLLEHERSGSAVSLMLTNSRAGVTLRYNKGSGNDAKLVISKSAFATSAGANTAGERLVDTPDETVLGERCHWWNMAKGMTDYGRAECRTEDGALLIVRTSSWGASSVMKATKFKRGAIPMKSILPPADILAPEAWGFLEHR
jgi:hypothetical protein